MPFSNDNVDGAIGAAPVLTLPNASIAKGLSSPKAAWILLKDKYILYLGAILV